MAHEMCETLQRAGVLAPGGPKRGAVFDASGADILDLIRTLAEPATPQPPGTDAGFVHAATLGLAGARTPCVHVDCRLKWSAHLARFAALYSDQVYAYNFLAEHLNHGYAVGEGSELSLKKQFYDDLRVLSSLRPLIDAGLIAFVNPPSERCAYHAAVQLIGRVHGNDGIQKLEAAETLLANAYLRDSHVALRRTDRAMFAVLSGPPELYEHGGVARKLGDLPPGLQRNLRLTAALRARHEVALTLEEREALQFHQSLAEEAVAGLAFELVLAELLGASLVTERRFHIDLLNAISGRDDFATRNLVALEHLTTIVPFTAELTPAQIVEVRQREPEAFITYRTAINRAIGAYMREGDAFTAGQAKALYGDVIAPGLADLTVQVHAAKKEVMKGAERRLVAWTGALTFGLYTGIVPDAIVDLAAAAGVTDVLRQLLEGALEASDADDRGKTHELYFLWQLQKIDGKP